MALQPHWRVHGQVKVLVFALGVSR